MTTTDERRPFLKRMTAITEGVSPDVDSRNMIESLYFLFNYGVAESLLMTILDAYDDILPDHISFAEGFVSKKIAESEGMEVHDEDSHEFRNVIFTIEGVDLRWLMDEVISDLVSKSPYKGYLQSITLDVDSGWVLIKIKPDGAASELDCKIMVEENGVVTEIEQSGEETDNE